MNRSAISPSRISTSLRRIASAIENSENPSRELVARELQRLVRKIAGNEDGISVLGQTVNVEVPGLGLVPVILTKVEFFDEKNTRNVVGTINGFMVKTSTYSRSYKVDPTDILPVELKQYFDPEGFRPVDAFAIAIDKILKNYGIEDEYPIIENGIYFSSEQDDDSI